MKVERPLAKLRSGEYPGVGDQLDAIWKLVRVLVDAAPADANLPAEALAVMDQVQAVKDALPKR